MSHESYRSRPKTFTTFEKIISFINLKQFHDYQCMSSQNANQQVSSRWAVVGLLISFRARYVHFFMRFVQQYIRSLGLVCRFIFDRLVILFLVWRIRAVIVEGVVGASTLHQSFVIYIFGFWMYVPLVVWLWDFCF